MRQAPIEITRARIEAKIEELIALLDLVDGDENLEPYLADTRGTMGGSADDREGDDSDREPNGDELDTCFTEDEWHVRFGQ